MGSNDVEGSGALGRRRPLSESPLRQQRVDTYRRLRNAEAQLDDIRKRRGLPETAIADVLDAIEGGSPRIEPQEDLYLRTVSRYIAELGGHIEVVAVFPEERVTLMEDADPPAS